MTKYFSFILIYLGCVALGPGSFGQAAPPRGRASAAPSAAKPAPTTAQAAANGRRSELETQLKSGNKDQIAQAFAAYKAWLNPLPPDLPALIRGQEKGTGTNGIKLSH